MSVINEANFIFSIKFAFFLLLLCYVLPIESTEKEQVVTDSNSTDGWFSGKCNEKTDHTLKKDKYDSYDSGPDNAQEPRSFEEPITHSESINASETLEDKKNSMPEHTDIKIFTAQGNNAEQIVFDFPLTEETTNNKNMLMVEVLGEDTVISSNENEYTELEVDDSILNNIIKETLDNRNITSLNEFVENIMDYEANEQPFFMEQHTTESNFHILQPETSNIKRKLISIDSLNEETSYSENNIQTNPDLIGPDTYIHDDKNLDSTITENALESIKVESLNNEPTPSLKTYGTNFILWNSREKEFLLLEDAMKPSSIDKIENLIEEIGKKEDTESSLDEKPCCSGFHFQGISTDTEDDTDDETDELRNINHNINEKTVVSTNVPYIDLRCIRRGHLMKNTYLSNFQIALVKMTDINMYVKDFEPESIDKVRSFLDIIRTYHKSYIQHMDVCFSLDRKVTQSTFLTNLITKVHEFSQFPDSSDKSKDAFSILDSRECMHIYLHLLSNFLKRTLRHLRRGVKGLVSRKEKVLKGMPSKEKELTRNVKKLRRMFYSLVIYIHQNSKLYSLQGFYALIYHVQNIFSDVYEESHFCPIVYLTRELLEIWRNFNCVYGIMILDPTIDIRQLLNSNANDDTANTGQRIEYLLSTINQKQEEIKTHINNNLEKSTTIMVYILYHICYLLIQRCFTSVEGENKLQDVLKVYKSFLLLWNSMYSDFFLPFDYPEPSQREQHLLLTDESSLYGICAYILLNIVKRFLTEISEKHATYINMLQNFYKNEKYFFERNYFHKKTEFYRNSFSILESLIETLKEITSQQSFLIPYMHLFSLGEKLNKYIYNIIFKLKSIKRANTPDETHSEIEQGYQALRTMYTDYLNFAKHHIP